MSTINAPHSSHYHFKIGIGYILLSWLFFTLTSPLVRQISQDIPMSFILSAQGAIGFLSIIPWVIRHGKESLKTKSWALILFRSICGLLIYTFLFLSMLHTSLVDTFLLNNTAPLFLPFVTWIWVKKSIEHKLWFGLIGGFIGILLILKPGAEILNVGALYGLAMGILAALVMVSLRLLSYTTRTHTVLFYYFLISFLAPLPLAVLSGKIPSGIDWIKLLSIGILSTLAQVCMIRAFHHGKPTSLGPFNYSAIIYAGLLDWILYGTRPDLLSWIGIVLICLGGIWSIRYSKMTPPPSSFFLGEK